MISIEPNIASRKLVPQIRTLENNLSCC